MNPAQQTAALGQSLWLDNLSRSLIHDGILEAHIADHAITGVTSNPSIFQNALATSPYYAEDLARLRTSEPDPERRYEALAIPDIQAACDLHDAVYDRSGGLDGFVSLEVAPRWAYDTSRTVEEAQRLSAAVSRRNLLVKVPGTPEGVAAFEALTTLGINVNITLLFSLAQTQAIFDAYVRGLAARAQAGGDIRKSRAVASLFLSRVDTLVDKQLEAIGSNENLLESELECLTKVLSNPAHYIHFEPKHLRLNTMNVLVNESSTDRVADVDFSVAQLSGTPPMRRAFVLARVARSEMPPPPQINFGDAARYL